jgi:hypothetical protein
VTTWRNKRPHGAYALTASNAFYWHAGCPCQDRKPAAWRQISGKGAEGSWAAAWLEWLWRTHLAPRGVQRVDTSGKRTLDLSVDDNDIAALRAAISAGPKVLESAPTPPFDPSDGRRAR